MHSRQYNKSTKHVRAPSLLRARARLRARVQQPSSKPKPRPPCSRGSFILPRMSDHAAGSAALLLTRLSAGERGARERAPGPNVSDEICMRGSSNREAVFPSPRHSSGQSRAGAPHVTSSSVLYAPRCQPSLSGPPKSAAPNETGGDVRLPTGAPTMRGDDSTRRRPAASPPPAHAVALSLRGPPKHGQRPRFTILRVLPSQSEKGNPDMGGGSGARLVAAQGHERFYPRARPDTFLKRGGGSADKRPAGKSISATASDI